MGFGHHKGRRRAAFLQSVFEKKPRAGKIMSLNQRPLLER